MSIQTAIAAMLLSLVGLGAGVAIFIIEKLLPRKSNPWDTRRESRNSCRGLTAVRVDTLAASHTPKRWPRTRKWP